MTDHLKILSLILFKESNIEQLLVYSPNFHVSAHSYVRGKDEAGCSTLQRRLPHISCYPLKLNTSVISVHSQTERDKCLLYFDC